MPCRYAGGNRTMSDRGIDSGQLKRTALVIGGREALATTVSREGPPELYPEAPTEADREGHQHAWDVDTGGECPVPHGDGDADHGDGADHGEGGHHDYDGGDADDHGHGSGDNDAGSGGGCPAHDDAETEGDHGSEEYEGDHGSEEYEGDHGSEEYEGDHGSEGDGSGGAHGDDHGSHGDHGDSGVEGEPSPLFHVFLRMHYLGSTPTEEERETVESALEELERAFGWGPDGVVFSLGYSASYFERFEAVPEPMAATAEEEPTLMADGAPVGEDKYGYDAVLHVASDDVTNLLAAEAALWGEQTPVDLELGSTFEGVFSHPQEPPARRAAVAARDGAVPDGSVSIPDPIGSDQFTGGVVERMVSYDPEAVEEPDDEESDSDSDAEGCPAHGDDADESDARGDDNAGDAGGESGGCPAHEEGTESAQEEDDDSTLVGDVVCLNPADPTPVDLEYEPVRKDPDLPDAARREEAYLVPPVAERALPVPRGS